MPRPASLSLELLRTFLTLVRRGGDASGTAAELNINQPSMSKRLGYLQHAGPVLARPWLVREGKTWKLTEEGQAVLPAVEEIVQRYAQLKEFVEQRDTRPRVQFACGTRSAATFVRRAVHRYLRREEFRDVRLRLATLRGQARIERVANGSLDLATVDHDEETIHEIARRPLYTRPLVTEHLVLVCAADSPWAAAVRELPAGKIKPRMLEGMPLVLPEPDSGTRRRFDAAVRAKGRPTQLDVALEIGGWATLLAYVRDGLGVGIAGEATVREADSRERPALVTAGLDPKTFPPLQTRVIARRRHGNPEDPDLTPAAAAFLEALAEAARGSHS
ncbi:MAG TPA: LysR family transcriptional regulator [Gemmataceae bacterium]